MAYLFDTAQRLVRDQTGSAYTSLSQTRTNVSIAMWYRPIAIGVAQRTLLTIQDTRTATATEQYRISEITPAAKFRVLYDDATSTAVTSDSTGLTANDVWYLVVANFGSTGTAMTYASIDTWSWKTGDASITLGTGASFAARAQVQAMDNLAIGSSGISTQTAGANGYIAEVSVWSKLLDSTEITLLTTGAASLVPSYVASCLNYWPLVTDLLDVKGGMTLSDPVGTITSTAAIHPIGSTTNSIGPKAGYMRMMQQANA